APGAGMSGPSVPPMPGGLDMRPTRIGGRWIIAALLLTLGPVRAPELRAQQSGGYDPTLFAGLECRNIGPNRGGRSIAVAGSVARPNEYYFGATGGGLWKTTDGGQTWRPVTD